MPNADGDRYAGQGEKNSFDAVVIGAGQAGGPLAGALGKAGWKVALVEKKHVGGTCVNEGCTPTKTMVASARVAYLARRAADYGVSAGDVTVDMVRVRARKREVVESFRSGSQKSVEKNENVTLIWGEARFVAPYALEVTADSGQTREVRAEKIFINVGARPTLPPVPGLDRVPVLDSTTVMELGELPEHLLVMGGGYIGLEFAQMFRRFGSEVTIVQHGPQLLGREDKDVADEIAHILREDGITVQLNAEVTGAEDTGTPQNGDAGISLSVEGEGGRRSVNGSHLLVATGRTPNSDLLNLRAAGVKIDDRGFIETNGALETSVPGIYALGDVKGGPAFTHISYDDYRIVRDNLLQNANKTLAARLVPYTVFIDPQLGRVGLSEKEAREAGFEVKVAKLPMKSVARALETGETRGFMKAVIDAESDQILGAAILGLEGGEVMSVLQVAMMGGLTYEALRDSPFAHPLLSESLNNLFTTIS